MIRLKSYLLFNFMYSWHVTFSAFTLILLFLTAIYFLKTQRSLFVLKVPLNPSQSITQSVEQLFTYSSIWHPEDVTTPSKLVALHCHIYNIIYNYHSTCKTRMCKVTWMDSSECTVCY